MATVQKAFQRTTEKTKKSKVFAPAHKQKSLATQAQSNHMKNEMLAEL